MTWWDLRSHWLDALAAAAAALEAATVARALASDTASAERKRLADERAWVEATWPDSR